MRTPAAPVPARTRRGCFGPGCFILLGLALILFIALGGTGWWFFNRTVKRYTAETATRIQPREPSQQDLATVDAKIHRIADATAAQRATSVEFTAADLNTLIAREPELADLRGHSQVTIADSFVTLDLSAQITDAPLDRINGRWLNGRLVFAFSYVDGKFFIKVKSVQANGATVPQWVVARVFTEAFTSALTDELKKKTGEKWRHIDAIAVEGDKLLVTTKPAL